MSDSCNAPEAVSPIVKFARWCRRMGHVQFSDLEGCGTEEVERIARDIGVTAWELRLLAAKNPASALLLDRRLATLPLDQAELRREQPMVLRDLQKTCSLCEAYGRCRDDLAEAPGNTLWQEYCPNALTLRELVAASPEPSDMEDLIAYWNVIGGPREPKDASGDGRDAKDNLRPTRDGEEESP